MVSTTGDAITPARQVGRGAAASVGIRLLGVVLGLAVAAVHVIGQGGLPGAKDPTYVQYLYYILEVGAVVTALALLVKAVRLGWLLSLGVALGPILGYVLSRGPGLPYYTDDIGNWTEPLGITSLAVEGVLLILAASMVVSALGRRR